MSVDHSVQRRGVNSFLGDLYDRERLLSHILQEQGASDEELSALHSAADPFVADVVRAWRSWWAEILDERRCTVLMRRYVLDGQEPATLRALGDDLDLSRERIRQLHSTALRRLSTTGRRSTLERLVLEQARKYTGEAKEEASTPTLPQGDCDAH